MTTETATQELSTTEDTEATGLATLANMEEAIGQMIERSKDLVITNVNDKVQVTAVTEAHKAYKRVRQNIESTRVTLVSPHLERQRAVNKVAKHVTACLADEEKRLAAEREKVKIEAKRLADQRAAEAAAKLQDRVDRLEAVGGTVVLSILTQMSDSAFDQMLADQRALHARTELAKELQIGLHKYGREMSVAELLELDATEQDVLLMSAKQEHEAAEAERREKEEAAKAEADRLAEENRKQQAEIEQLRKEKTDRDEKTGTPGDWAREEIGLAVDREMPIGAIDVDAMIKELETKPIPATGSEAATADPAFAQRQQMLTLIDDWYRYATNNNDVLASSVLDDLTAFIESVRP